jgi:hypothetical protein
MRLQHGTACAAHPTMCGTPHRGNACGAAPWCRPCSAGVTLTDDYYSAWQCRTMRSPWSAPAPGQQPTPACALILCVLHRRADTWRVPPCAWLPADVLVLMLAHFALPASTSPLHTHHTHTPHTHRHTHTHHTHTCRRLHSDDLKVPEYLARAAIKLGMWRFVQVRALSGCAHVTRRLPLCVLCIPSVEQAHNRVSRCRPPAAGQRQSTGHGGACRKMGAAAARARQPLCARPRRGLQAASWLRG